MIAPTRAQDHCAHVFEYYMRKMNAAERVNPDSNVTFKWFRGACWYQDLMSWGGPRFTIVGPVIAADRNVITDCEHDDHDDHDD